MACSGVVRKININKSLWFLKCVFVKSSDIVHFFLQFLAIAEYVTQKVIGNEVIDVGPGRREPQRYY